MSTHRVTITVPDPENPDDIEWKVEHMADDPTCAVWRPCEQCSPWEAEKLSMRDDICLHDNVTYHGVEHALIECEWMTRTSECGLQQGWSDHDWVYDVFAEAGSGTHEIAVEYEGDGNWFGVIPANPQEACHDGS